MPTRFSLPNPLFVMWGRGRQVKQSTFDSIVREAIDDFGLTPEEALSDAREQLQKAGVTDFSNIITALPPSDPSTDHEGISFPAQLEQQLKNPNPTPLSSILSHFSKRASVSREVAGVAGSNNAVFLSAQALSYALTLSDPIKSTVLAPACELIISLCSHDEVNRSRFMSLTDPDAVRLLLLALPCISFNEQLDLLDFATCSAVLRAVCAIQRQCEGVKQRIAADDTPQVLLCVLRAAGEKVCESNDAVMLFSAAATVVKQMLTSDDVAVAASEVFNRALVFGGVGCVTASGLRAVEVPGGLGQVLKHVVLRVREGLEKGTLEKEVACALLENCISCVRACALSDEICCSFIKLRFDEVAFEAMQRFADVSSLMLACLSLLRNLAARDLCKTPIFNKMSVLRNVAEAHMLASVTIVEYYGGLLSNLCLRRPDIAKEMAISGIIDSFLSGMWKHEKSRNVQRIGCIVVRNVCSRDVEARQYLQEGRTAEKVVRRAWKSFPADCHDVAYSALRDLDVLADEELRRDERYAMPAGFYKTKTNKKET